MAPRRLSVREVGKHEVGVLATKARLVVRYILEEIRQPNAEVFPKQDRLDTRTAFGNYIYAPLFGALVPEGRTVFLDPRLGLTPFTDQWQFLENVERVREEQVDEIIELNELGQLDGRTDALPQRRSGKTLPAFGLPPCAQRMLADGVTEFQRVSCFRLAVQLKKAGLPEDIAVASLRAWAAKNRPARGRRVIMEAEILAQVVGAYSKDYRSCGCDDPAVAPYCDPGCRLFQRNDDRRRPIRAAPPAEHLSNEASGSVPGRVDTMSEEHPDAQG